MLTIAPVNGPSAVGQAFGGLAITLVVIPHGGVVVTVDTSPVGVVVAVQAVVAAVQGDQGGGEERGCCIHSLV